MAEMKSINRWVRRLICPKKIEQKDKKIKRRRGS